LQELGMFINLQADWGRIYFPWRGAWC